MKLGNTYRMVRLTLGDKEPDNRCKLSFLHLFTMGLKQVPAHLLLRRARWNSVQYHHYHNLESFLINKSIFFFSYFDYNE